jgi:hypothetical protein
MKKLFGGINLTWPKLIVFAIIAGIYTAVMAMLPIVKDTSFADITITFEVWILFGTLIIMNSKSAVDSALKCFVFFLISQPLVYLLQVPFSSLGWQILGYYKNWIVWTICTIPMGFVGYYMKKDKWWGLLILAPVIAFLAIHYGGFLGRVIYNMPYHLLSTLFCIVTMIIYPIAIFKNKIIKIVGVSISVLAILIMTIITVFSQSITYKTTILVNGGELGATFDDTYKVYLEDESLGNIYIVKDKNLDDYMVNAEFKKAGKTNVILEDSNGHKETYEITIKTDSYDINKVSGANSEIKNETKNETTNEVKNNKVENMEVYIKVNGQVLSVELEDNLTTKEFKNRIENGDIVVKTSEYGGFEKVGSLGFSLPREDKNITTSAGDIVLYQGNQISLFYESNSWSYTKLGRIKGVTAEELKKILGSGDVSITFTNKK